MKFPSAQTLIETTTGTLKRFPLVIFFMVIACFCGITISHTVYVYNNPEYQYLYYNIIRAAYLGMLLSLAFAVYAERKKFSVRYKLIAALIIPGLVIIYYLSLPPEFSDPKLIQFILFMIGLHLFISFAPFTAIGEVNAFWQYNKTLFLRFLAAFLYSTVLFIGLALAILAIDQLFSVHISDRWYVDLSIFIFGAFSTIFFLAGLPADFEQLEQKTDYPKALKIFTQYVLLPIIAVYLVILYAYLFKIIGTHNWPQGWVGYLVLAFSVAGILSLLLIHPVRHEANNKWIIGFSRFFYLALCPLIVLLFLAIFRRVNEYGITEERYFVIGLAGWLALITLYFIFSRNKNIKLIPITLGLLVFLVSFGPWGAFSISFRSQTTRLREYIQRNNMFSADQKIIPPKQAVNNNDAQEMRSIINYLVNNHGYQSLQPLFAQDLKILTHDTVTGNRQRYTYGQAGDILAYMKLGSSIETNSRTNYFRMLARTNEMMLPVSGYEFLVSDYRVTDERNADSVKNNYGQGKEKIYILFLRRSGLISIRSGMDSAIRFNLPALVKLLKRNDLYNDKINVFSRDSMMLSGENKNFSVSVVLNDIYVKAGNDTATIDQFSAQILVHFKQP